MVRDVFLSIDDNLHTEGSRVFYLSMSSTGIESTRPRLAWHRAAARFAGRPGH